MDVVLLEKVKESIADTSKPFYWGSWDQCVAGHTFMVLNMDLKTENNSPAYAAKRLGLTDKQMQYLFLKYGKNQARDRGEAIRRIDSIIKGQEIAVKPTFFDRLVGYLVERVAA